MTTEKNSKAIKDRIKAELCDYVMSKAGQSRMESDEILTIRLENLMIEQYNADPSINFAVCRKRVQPHIPELYLTDGNMRSALPSASEQ